MIFHLPPLLSTFVHTYSLICVVIPVGA